LADQVDRDYRDEHEHHEDGAATVLICEHPQGSRISEPVSTGVAASKPNSVSLEPSVSLMGIPMIENITQTAKQIVKAKVLALRTEICL